MSTSYVASSTSPGRCNASAPEIEIKAPKYGSERIVNLPDELVAMLAHHVDTYTDKGAVARWLFQREPATRRTRTPSATGGASPRRTPA